MAFIFETFSTNMKANFDTMEKYGEGRYKRERRLALFQIRSVQKIIIWNLKSLSAGPIVLETNSLQQNTLSNKKASSSQNSNPFNEKNVIIGT